MGFSSISRGCIIGCFREMVAMAGMGWLIAENHCSSCWYIPAGHAVVVARGGVVGNQPSPYPEAHGAGWSSPVARRAHNPKVAGSNPAPATIEGQWPSLKPVPRDRLHASRAGGCHEGPGCDELMDLPGRGVVSIPGGLR